MSTVLACASCVASAFGDRTFNWPYLSLIIMPFIVAVAISGVLAYYAGVRPSAILGSIRAKLVEGRSPRTIFDHFTELFHRSPRPSDGLGSHGHARLGRRTASPRTTIPKETT